MALRPAMPRSMNSSRDLVGNCLSHWRAWRKVCAGRLPQRLASAGFTALRSRMPNKSDLSAPTAADVDAAARRLAGVALRTPLVSSPVLDAATGARVFLKAETLQRTGSVQFRGGFDKPSAIAPDKGASGVVPFPSGNHAQGGPHAAKLLDIPSVIVTPSDAPRPKRE